MADTFTCTIELDKSAGITIKLVNATKNITQTVTMDGTALTIKFDDANAQKSSTITQKNESVVTEVKNQTDTSTVTQKADSITLKCKDFTIDADSVTVKSTKDMKHEATGKYTVTAQQDLAVTGSQKVDVKSTMDMTIKSTQNLTAEATANLSLKGLNSELKGTTKAAIDGGTQVSISGVQIGASATAALTLEGEVTSVGKSMTTVKGQMVNVQGSLVKLG